ncbi:RNA polymerase-binding transcription factor DksA [Roseivivax jejudonensis]|uniref:RNA polymerase-binding transcription factor DksA n=1 Tax=Roseivivax jejudonensis TaxID=1529041 RepID=A0A1X6YPB3_9RHOB|nr:TraR/DksA family transcriptional regulator [Roseivivax jejudonensis]SLN27450.1 RNA polymerase-binding transcription factor DksA [Roseivivax jejudonensis]
MTDRILADAEATLRRRRAELVAALGRIESALDETPNPDAEDRATEREGDEVLEALGRSDETELRAIDAALARIAEGTYGTCQTCGDTIARERLAAVPTAALCRDCARR